MLSAKEYLEMLKDYEQAAADLYDALADVSWFKKAVWKNLSAEGDSRIEKINKLIASSENDKNLITLKSFVGTEAVETKNFVLNILNLLDAGKISKREAVRRIADIENNVVESDLYGKLHSDNLDACEIIEALRKGIRGKISILNIEKKKWF